MKPVTRTAIVTGGGRGIGAAIAIALARRGIKVAVAARSARELERTTDLIRAAGGDAIAISANVALPNEVERVVVETGRRLGAPDILVNNAGLAESAPLARTDDALWDRHLATNLTAAFWFCRAVAPSMTSRGWGRIVNIASMAAQRGLPYTAAYAASKAGLVGLTHALASELGSRGVTVNAVCPGWVDTPLTAQAIDRVSVATGRAPEQIRKELLARGPQTRFLTADEVADLVGYLISDEARAVNGQAWALEPATLDTSRATR
jgi:3-hydroxybutyrate dehydrogenase